MTDKSKRELQMHFGALSKPVNEQLAEQGLCFEDPKDGEDYDALCNAVTSLMFSDVATDAEVAKMRQRLVRKIAHDKALRLLPETK